MLSPLLLFLFYILPFILVATFQIYLCIKLTKFIFKLIPFGLVAIILLLVFLCKTTGFLASILGGFVSLLLIGTCIVICITSILIWIVFKIIKLIKN